MPRTDTGRTAVRIAVVVVRTGGIAGMRREWTAEPSARLVPTWEAMLEDCPWDERLDVRGADRFQWDVTARRGDDRREARLGDAQLVGPWRTLVDAVRDYSDGA